MSCPLWGSERFTVAALDLGIKAMTPTLLAQQGIEVHVLPATSTIEDIRAVGEHGPDGVFFSNGPGDPATADAEVAVLREVLDARIPFFGICFGNQLLGPRAGLRHLQAQVRPPRDQPAGHGPHHRQGRGDRAQPRLRGDAPLDREVAAPADEADGTAYGRVRVSHVCLNDDVVEGLECLDLPAYSVQYHPEAAAGPHDAGYLFDRFVELMQDNEKGSRA